MRFETDERIDAALVAGSLGRRTADNWSDVDLVVVLDRDAKDDILTNRDEFVRRFGAAVFVFDSPWNAPLDGAQVNALYNVDGPWPLYVDWDLWPPGRGAVSPDVQVLLDRVGLPVTRALFDEYRSWPRQSGPDPTPERLRRARLAMLPIIAKCLVRRDLARAQQILANLGYQTGSTATDLAVAANTMWTDTRPDATEPLARTIDHMLLIASQVVEGA